MTTRLFKRACQLTLIAPSNQPNAFFQSLGGSNNAVTITDMRVTFSIEKHVKSDPNHCEVKVYNLAPRTRSLCEQRPLQVWLDAGYDGVLRQLFVGDLRYGYSKLHKPNWETILHLGDGDRAYRLARVNRTYGAGTQVLQAVKDSAASMGLTLDQGQIAKIPQLQAAFAGSRASQGAARDELTRLLAPYGVSWSIQNGRLQILSDADSLQGQAVVVSQDTGMIDTPVFSVPTRDGQPQSLRVKMLLYPQLVPGGLIQVKSRAIDNRLFRVQKLVHTGDTHGGDWLTEIDAIPVDTGAQTRT